MRERAYLATVSAHGGFALFHGTCLPFLVLALALAATLVAARLRTPGGGSGGASGSGCRALLSGGSHGTTKFKALLMRGDQVPRPPWLSYCRQNTPKDGGLALGKAAQQGRWYVSGYAKCKVESTVQDEGLQGQEQSKSKLWPTLRVSKVGKKGGQALPEAVKRHCGRRGTY